MKRFLTKITIATGGIAVFLAILVITCVITAIPVYFLWNWLMPSIFGIRVITFAESVGISLLCGCLFKTTFSSNNSD